MISIKLNCKIKKAVDVRFADLAKVKRSIEQLVLSILYTALLHHLYQSLHLLHLLQGSRGLTCLVDLH